MHISPVNNAPQIATGAYQPPNSCGTVQPDDECFFGQFFTLEDSAAAISVGGVGVDDADLYELCDFSAPMCKSIDMTVRADYGAVSLNTRSNLVIYVAQRNQQSFLASLAWAGLAVKVIGYQIALPGDVELASGLVVCKTGDTACGAALHFNTQREGGQREILYVSASDQACSKTPSCPATTP